MNIVSSGFQEAGTKMELGVQTGLLGSNTSERKGEDWVGGSHQTVT